MKTDFKLSNLLGTVYRTGNICFTPDGSALISPVGNRVTVLDLLQNKSHTLPLGHRKNIARLALDPRGTFLLTVDEDGKAILSHLKRRLVLYHLSFKGPVSALAFSPKGTHFAVAVGRIVELWQTPSVPAASNDGEIEFSPFVRHHRHAGHHDTITSVSWSGDSRFFITTSIDLTARVWSLDPEDGFVPTTLSGHRQEVRGAWFSSDQEMIYTISKDGALFEWQYRGRHDEQGTKLDDDDRWRIASRHFFSQDRASLTCATYHPRSNLLVAGFSNGVFTLHELPSFSLLSNLSISQHDIDHVAVNSTGEWLAFGASKLGQLLVWEWQSESYILKQQGHFDALNALAYSPDGQRIVTASDDGKVKVWDVQSGFCIVTFTEHAGAVTACQFSKRGNILFTASMDGSIRAWDMVRYRNFRTFTAPTRLSFSSLAVDPSGEVVCAGSSIDSFDIHVWSVQTGQLLDQLAAHEGPVSSLSFAATGGLLVSGSWDNTVRIWDVFSRTQTSEPLQLQSEVLSVAIRPDSKQVAVAALDGSLSYWSVSNATQEAGLDGRRDISGGRKLSDRRVAANVAGTKHFTTLTYSEDGESLLAGGRSKYICLYDVRSGVLLKKFTVSTSLSLDGTQEFLNSKNLTEAGPRGLLDTAGEMSDLEDRQDNSLPGATRGDQSVRRTRPEVRVSGLGFSPSGRSFCAAGTEGILIYSLDLAFQFDPLDLDVSVTPASTRRALQDGRYTTALVMAFRLNEIPLTRHVYEHVPPSEIQAVVNELPLPNVGQLLSFAASTADDSPHLEFNLMWMEAVLARHGNHLKQQSGTLREDLVSVQRATRKIQADLGRLADDNGFAIDYLIAGSTLAHEATHTQQEAISL